MPNINQQLFIEQFRIKVIIPVERNPDMLYKNYWLNKK